MKATDFTRHDCQFGRRRVTYEKLQREYRCAACGGRVGVKWSEKCEEYPEHWHAECLACGEEDFIHERESQRQQAEVSEVLDGLPPELAALVGHKELHVPAPVPLHAEPIEI